MHVWITGYDTWSKNKICREMCLADVSSRFVLL